MEDKDIPKSEPLKTASPGQDHNGRFVKGNKIAVGNKNAEKAAKYKYLAYKALTTGKWNDIIDRAITDAIAGDFKARQWISELVLGKAKQEIDATINSNLSPDDIRNNVRDALGLTPLKEEDKPNA